MKTTDENIKVEVDFYIKNIPPLKSNKFAEDVVLVSALLVYILICQSSGKRIGLIKDKRIENVQ